MVIKDDAKVTLECRACGAKIVMTYAEYKDAVPVVTGEFITGFQFQCIRCLR